MQGETPTAIYARHLSLEVQGRALLADISLDIPEGSFTAIIGASGCGKSTLIKSLAGLQSVTTGEILLAGHPVEMLKREFPLTVGYLPQFGAFHGDLTVEEILVFAAQVRLPPSVDAQISANWIAHIIELARLQPFLKQRYNTLSGGQMRRVALAEELIGDPPFLFLDELTSGLDPFSDQEMMEWLWHLAHRMKKTIVLVTHSMSGLYLCDSIILLNKGKMMFRGSYPELLSSHGVESPQELFKLYQTDQASISLPEASVALQSTAPEAQPLKTAKPPQGLRQFFPILARQLKLLWRDAGQIRLQLILILTFPCLVAVFAYEGLPQVRNLNMTLETNILATLEEQLLYLKESFHAASLISGLTMFQVVLLCLMGANNGAREIAKERDILRKELRTGLSPSAYLGSKLVLIGFLSLVQSFWMAVFVKTICGFPGSLDIQFVSLFATNLAVSLTCLAISARSKSAERASLLAIYLVGLQLPLSGAVLALPQWVSLATRPVIAAYWGWSGYLKSLANFRHYDIVRQTVNTPIAEVSTTIVVLSLHALLAVVAAWFWIRKTGRSAT